MESTKLEFKSLAKVIDLDCYRRHGKVREILVFTADEMSASGAVLMKGNNN